MNAYTISIDVAALSQEAASQAVKKVLFSRTRVSDDAAIKRDVPGFERFVALHQEGQRVGNPQPELPKNCRLISVEEAVEAWHNPLAFIEHEGAIVGLSQLYSEPCPVFGKDYSILFAGGGLYFCLPNDKLEQFLDAYRAKAFCERVNGRVNAHEAWASKIASAERGGRENDAATALCVGDDGTNGRRADNDSLAAVDDMDELGHSSSVAQAGQ